MQPGHTLGPWHIVELPQRKHTTGDRLAIAAPGANVCSLDIAGRENGKELANARLIAAAPFLLEMCERAEMVLNNVNRTYDTQIEQQQAIESALGGLRAAISKATRGGI